MKLVAFLLAVMVLFLSVQPAIASLQENSATQCGGGCCKEEAAPLTGAPATDDCGSGCNPLLGCSTCGGYLFANEQVAVAARMIMKPELPAHSPGTYSQFCVDVWQPPRLLQP